MQSQHPGIDQWIAKVDAVLAEQREHSISPSEGGYLPPIGVVEQWSTTFGDLVTSIEPLLDRLTRDPGRWVLVVEIDEAHDRFLRGVFYEDGSLVVETLGNTYLHGECQLSDEDAAVLVDLGWHEPLIGGRGTWAFIEATHSPEVSRVVDAVASTLRQVFKCLDSDPLILKLSSLSERGATAASETPIAVLDESNPTPTPRASLGTPLAPASDLAPVADRSNDYYSTLYPEPSISISEFGKWKRATTCRNIARAYWQARERAREQWSSIPHTTGEWELLHPPVVLWVPVAAEAACFACTWLGGGRTIEQAAELARQHSVQNGDDPSVVHRLLVPISARNGPHDVPLPRSSVPPQPVGRVGTVEEALLLGPRWVRHDSGGLGDVVSSTVILLDPPRATDDGPDTTLFLDVEIEEDGDGYIWRLTISEEEAAFGDSDLGSGGAVSIEQAELDCWETVVDLLRGEGYNAEEIVESVVGGVQ